MVNKAILLDIEETLLTNGRLYPDTIQFLESCKDEGLKVVAFTNAGPQSTKELLERQKVADLFDMIFSCPDYGMPKPDPKGVNVVRALLRDEHSFRVSKKNMFLVGDRPDNDICCGNRAGVPTIRVKRGNYSHLESDYGDEEPTYEVSDFAGVAKILEFRLKKKKAAPKKKAVPKKGKRTKNDSDVVSDEEERPSKREAPNDAKAREVDSDFLFR